MSSTDPIVGGLYTSRAPDQSYRVIKVLLVDDLAVHVRMYAERFDTIPVGISSSQLSMGSLGGQGGWGIGHLPMSLDGFLRGDRTLLATEIVCEEELDGYRVWAGEDPT